MSEIKMNSCPICDGEVYIGTEDYDDTISKVIVCDNCDLRFYGSHGSPLEEELIKEWNQRTPIKNMITELEKLKEKSEKKFHELMDSDLSLPCCHDKTDLVDAKINAFEESIEIVKKGLV